MKALRDFSKIFVRYDLVSEVEGKETTVKAKNKELQRVLDCVVKGDTYGIVAAVNDALKGNDPMDVRASLKKLDSDISGKAALK